MKKSPKMQCAIAVSLFRGLYARVADALGMDASYVSRIARGLRRSRVAETALTKEFNRVLSVIGKDSTNRRTRMQRARLWIPSKKHADL